MAEHISKWLRQQMNSNSQIGLQQRQIFSSFAIRLVETSYRAGIKSAIVVLCKSKQRGILRFIEVMPMRKLDFRVCAQKEFTLNFNLSQYF